MSESKSITLYKRNAQGKPIFWSAEILGHKIILKYGIVGKDGVTSEYVPPRGVEKEWKTIVAAKRREGGMELSELYDSAPQEIPDVNAFKYYLEAYLPKYNTNSEGFVLPMLAKIYEYYEVWPKEMLVFYPWRVISLNVAKGNEPQPLQNGQNGAIF